MIAEDYVNFETAKLLKDKGFDENCSRSYVKDKLAVSQGFNNSYYTTMYSDGTYRPISAPTLQMAMKWLRKNHGLHCNSDYDIVLGWYCQITSLNETVEYDYEEMKHYHPDKDNGFSSPEEACEAAIKYCLENLI